MGTVSRRRMSGNYDSLTPRPGHWTHGQLWRDTGGMLFDCLLVTGFPKVPRREENNQLWSSHCKEGREELVPHSPVFLSHALCYILLGIIHRVALGQEWTGSRISHLYFSSSGLCEPWSRIDRGVVE
jgi:hypothetical protein